MIFLSRSSNNSNILHHTGHSTIRSVKMGTYKNIFTTAFDIAIRPKLYSLKIGIKTTKGERHLFLFFHSNCSLLITCKKAEKTSFHPLSTRAGANSFGHSYPLPYEPRPPHISPPQRPWKQLSAPQKYCSSSFSLYWLPVSPQFFHRPHTLKPLLTPTGFVLWSKHWSLTAVPRGTAQKYSTSTTTPKEHRNSRIKQGN